MQGKQGEPKLVAYASTNITKLMGINGFMGNSVECHTVIPRFNPKWKPMLIKQKGCHNLNSVRSDFSVSLTPSG